MCCEGSPHRRAPMRSRRCSGPGRPLGDTKVSGRRVTCKAPLAHLEGGSGRSKTSPTAILQDTHSLEGEFSEVSLEKWPPGIYDPLRLGTKIRSIVKPGASGTSPSQERSPAFLSSPRQIHWAAWIGARFNFALTEFSEVRLNGILGVVHILV